MLEVLGVVAPVYLAVAVGYLAVRSGLFPASGVPMLGAYVVRIGLPALLFGVLVRGQLTEVLHPTYLLAYGLGSLLALGVGYVLTVRGLRGVPGLPGDPQVARVRAAYLGLGSGMANSGYVGYPVLHSAMPQVAGPAFGMNVLVENLLMIPLGLALAERADGGHLDRRALVRQIVGHLSRQPMILAILAGVIVSLIGVRLPEPVDATLALFAQATTGTALFVIGGLLVGQRLGGRVREISPLLVGKLLVHPLAVGGLAYGAITLTPRLGLPPLDTGMAAAALVSACAPTISILPVLAARHGQEEVVSAASFATTLFSLLTLSGALVLVDPGHL